MSICGEERSPWNGVHKITITSVRTLVLDGQSTTVVSCRHIKWEEVRRTRTLA